MKSRDSIPHSTSTPTIDLIAPHPDMPRVGIIAVNLPADSNPLRSVWLDQDTLMVGYDPTRLTRPLVELILTDKVGAYLDIDGGDDR